MPIPLNANQGKNLAIQVGDETYLRLPVQTHVITKSDDILEVVKRYIPDYLQVGDILFMSERVVAITQGRAFAVKDIKPSALANFLCRFVHKTPAGIGIGSPWTMELALREVGAARMLLASLVAAITKPFGIKGMFYHIVGSAVRSIDGPCSYTLPPYNEYAVLGPKNPNQVAARIKQALGCEVVIIDANDLGVDVLGRSDTGVTEDFCRQVFRDNPLGQSSERTPLCLVRKQAVSS